MFSLIIAAWLALGAAALSPGPNLVAVAGRALGSGRAAALWVAAGLALGAFIWAIATSLGLAVLFARFPSLLTALGFIGGGYLMWMGAKGIRSALKGSGSSIAPNTTQASPLSYIIHGLLVSGTNPKVALLWASVSTFVTPAITGPMVLMVFASGAATIIFSIYGGFGLLFSATKARTVYANFQKTADLVFGGMFAALGAGLVHRSL